VLVLFTTIGLISNHSVRWMEERRSEGIRFRVRGRGAFLEFRSELRLTLEDGTVQSNSSSPPSTSPRPSRAGKRRGGGSEVIAHRHGSPDDAALPSCPFLVLSLPSLCSSPYPCPGQRQRDCCAGVEREGIDGLLSSDEGMVENLLNGQSLGGLWRGRGGRGG
jgi:hypothetical protein